VVKTYTLSDNGFRFNHHNGALRRPNVHFIDRLGARKRGMIMMACCQGSLRASFLRVFRR
jgi:hypothetical protein